MSRPAVRRRLQSPRAQKRAELWRWLLRQRHLADPGAEGAPGWVPEEALRVQWRALGGGSGAETFGMALTRLRRLGVLEVLARTDGTRQYRGCEPPRKMRWNQRSGR